MVSDNKRDPEIDAEAASQCSVFYVAFYDHSSRRSPIVDRSGWCITARTPRGRMFAITRAGVGLFSSRMDAERAIVGLKSEGVTTLMQLRELGFQGKLAEKLYQHQCW